MNSLLQFQRSLKLYCQNHEYKNGSYLYTIKVSINQADKCEYEVKKTKKEISKFHQLVQKCVFQLEQPFEKKFHNKQDSQQTIAMINVYLNHIQTRLDCLSSRHFVQFFEIQQNYSRPQILNKQFVEQLSEVKINPGNEQIVDIEWQPQERTLFVISQCKKPKKITNFLKQLISNQTVINGTLQMIRFSQEQNKWINFQNQLIQAEPLKLTWNGKSSTLIISTLIGIYVYFVSFGHGDPKLNLIDFVEMPGIQSVYCDSQTAQVYILSNGINNQSRSKLCSYSIKKQINRQIPLKLTKAKSMTFEKGHRRMYISQDQGIQVIKVENDQARVMLQNFKKLHLIKYDSSFQQLVLSSDQKPQYLFGYSKRGFISVFQLKPPQKQHLISILTNIECPENYLTIEKIWPKKIFCLDFQGNLVFIGMKNQPIYVKQSPKGNTQIKKIIYDEQNQRLMYCDNNSLKICEIKF